jgi:hypothetical protein
MQGGVFVGRPNLSFSFLPLFFLLFHSSLVSWLEGGARVEGRRTKATRSLGRERSPALSSLLALHSVLPTLVERKERFPSISLLRFGPFFASPPVLVSGLLALSDDTLAKKASEEVRRRLSRGVFRLFLRGDIINFAAPLAK